MSTPVKNFAFGTVSTGYSASDTSIVLNTGHGSRFPATFPYPVTWWNSTDYAHPALDPNKEIVIVTVRTADTLTVTRGAEGTSASTKNTAGKTYNIFEGITEAMWEELQNLSLSQDFRGLRLQTHPDSDVDDKKVRLIHADAIVMDDGQEVPSWDDIDADITASGAGGLDTGSEAASTWYSIHAIYNGTLKKLELHREKDYFLDETYTTGEDATQGLRSAVDNSTIRIAQGFKVDVAGPCEFIDVKLIRAGSAPTGNIWFTIEANSGGVPSNTPLATSDKYDAARISTTALFLRFPFRTPASLSAATQYHLVMYGDYTVSASNYIGWRMDGSAASYANGSKALFDSDTSTWTLDTDDDMMFKIYITENDVVFTPPAGYSQALIGYVYNDSGSNFKEFWQNDRMTFAGVNASWNFGTFGAGTYLIDAAAFLPPVSMVLQLLINQITVDGQIAVGQLSATDVGAGSERAGTVSAKVLTASVGVMGSIALGPYQGFMLDVANSSARPYVGSFIW